MNRKQKVVIIIAVAVLVAMIVFPPYAGIDRGSEGRIHGSLGFYPFWNPPTSQDVFDFLRQEFPGELDGVQQNMDDTRLSSFEPIFNKVMFIFNATLSLLVAAILLVVFRTRKKGRAV